MTDQEVHAFFHDMSVYGATVSTYWGVHGNCLYVTFDIDGNKAITFQLTEEEREPEYLQIVKNKAKKELTRILEGIA